VGTTAAFDDGDVFLRPFPADASVGLVHDGFATIYESLEVLTPEALGARAAIKPSARYGASERTTPLPSFAAQVDAAIAHDRSLHGFSADGLPVLTVAGHSLGAALITLYVLEHRLEVPGTAVSGYTFGSPRVGDAAFAAYYDALEMVDVDRVHIKQDVVPNVPPDSWYVHVDGAGVEIVDSGVRNSVPCHHAITTYMATLDATHLIPAECVP
jgi:pimeloyl-ACP methyl ester carboxylesterase